MYEPDQPPEPASAPPAAPPRWPAQAPAWGTTATAAPRRPAQAPAWAPAWAVPATAPPRRGLRRGRVWVVAAACVALLLVVTGMAAVTNGVPASRWAATSALDPSAAGPPPAPEGWGRLEKVLAEQAAALLRGDQRGWLAPVDAANTRLRTHYRKLFTTLRALGVTDWRYHTTIPPVLATGGRSDVDVYAVYCFHRPTCPAFDVGSSGAAPRIEQTLTVERRDGRYVITALKLPADPYEKRPTPWEGGTLAVAQGRHVTVAAPPALAGRLGEVVAAADRAAVAVDRFTRYLDIPRRRYLVYLAGDKEWNRWYGGAPGRHSRGYARPVGRAGSEVVLKMSALPGGELAKVLRHEFGHVVTLAGTEDGLRVIATDFDRWLTEGIAEYIAYAPQPAGASSRMPSVRAFVRSGRMRPTVASVPVPDKAGLRDVSAFYGLGHLAVSCLVSRYGEARMFRFFQRTVWQGTSYDKASRDVFGRAWKAVDRDCVAYVRRAVG